MSKRSSADIVRDLRAMAEDDTFEFDARERLLREAADRLEAASNTATVREFAHGIAMQNGCSGPVIYEIGNIGRTIAAAIASGDIERK